MPGIALPDHLPRPMVQSREQRCGPVPNVVVRLAGNAVRFTRLARDCAIVWRRLRRSGWVFSSSVRISGSVERPEEEQRGTVGILSKTPPTGIFYHFFWLTTLVFQCINLSSAPLVRLIAALARPLGVPRPFGTTRLNPGNRFGTFPYLQVCAFPSCSPASSSSPRASS